MVNSNEALIPITEVSRTLFLDDLNSLLSDVDNASLTMNKLTKLTLKLSFEDCSL